MLKRTEKKILIVDDDADTLLSYKIVLEYNGFAVDTFTNPLLALSSFNPNYYDLIILDIKMPLLDGFEMFEKLKEIDNRVKICFLTASGMYYKNFRDKGCCYLDKDLFIKKPIENKDLIKRINQIMQTKRMSLVL